MTDREMLEAAAKAVGEKVPPRFYPDGSAVLLSGQRWNPLTDSADRYRLARACRLVIDFDGGEVRWYQDAEEVPRTLRWMPGGNEEIEARAIVRAAAEIGRAK